MGGGLSGLRIGITRAAEQADSLSRLIEQRGGEPVLLPALCLREPPSWAPFDEAAALLPGGFDGIVFTSANAVERTLDRLAVLGAEPCDVLDGLLTVVVGTATSEMVASRGLVPDIVPEEFHSEGLLEALESRVASGLRGTRWFLPRALVARDVLPRGLEARRAQVIAAPVYQVAPPLDPEPILARLEQGVDVVTFASGSAVTNLQALVGDRWGELLDGVAVAALGPVTADACVAAGLQVSIQPPEARMEALVDSTVAWAAEGRA